jgi:hypothetical protein
MFPGDKIRDTKGDFSRRLFRLKGLQPPTDFCSPPVLESGVGQKLKAAECPDRRREVGREKGSCF